MRALAGYPGTFEMKTFCTFHWAIYMTNNRCACKLGTLGSFPHTYKWVETRLTSGPLSWQDQVLEAATRGIHPAKEQQTEDQRDMQRAITAYQNELIDAFPRIQTNVFK